MCGQNLVKGLVPVLIVVGDRCRPERGLSGLTWRNGAEAAAMGPGVRRAQNGSERRLSVRNGSECWPVWGLGHHDRASAHQPLQQSNEPDQRHARKLTPIKLPQTPDRPHSEPLRTDKAPF